MAVISYASGKGGVGKSTACLIAACELSLGGKVILIDSDPNQPIGDWWEKGRREDDCPTLEIRNLGNAPRKELVAQIQHAETEADLVLVDCEGIQAPRVVAAIENSTLVVVPMRLTEIDLKYAGEVISRIAHIGVPFSVLFSSVKAAVWSRGNHHVAKQMQNGDNTHLFRTHMIEREPFAAIWSFRTSLRRLPPSQVRNLEGAIDNADAYANEVFRKVAMAQKEAS